MVQGARRGGVQRQAVFGGAADAGVDFVGVVAGVVVGGAADGFGQVDAVGGFPLGVQFPEGFVGCPAGGVQLVHEVDDMVLHALEASDGRAELDTGAAVFHRHFINLLGAAHLEGAQQGDGGGGGLLQGGPAAGKGAVAGHGAAGQGGRALNLHSVQAHFGQVPGEACQQPDGDAGGVGGNQGQPYVLPVFGAHGANQVGSGGGIVHIDLAAGDAVAVAVGHGDGLHVGRVPAVIGFGNRQGDGAASGGDVGQQRAFLRFGAGFQDGQRAQGRAAEMGAGDGAAAQFLKEYAGIGEGTALSAVLRGDDDAEPAGGGQLLPGFRRGRLARSGQFQQRFFGVFGVHEPAHRRLEHFLFFSEGQVH